MKHHQSTVGKNDEWLTPPEILAPLGRFDLDPCAPQVQPWPTADRRISLPTDGLAVRWSGRVWLNPPFNRYARPRWMAKMASHGNGIMLIPAATETEAFNIQVWSRADAVCFVHTRPHFHFLDGTRAPFNCGTAICLVAYGAKNGNILNRAGLGKTITL